MEERKIYGLGDIKEVLAEMEFMDGPDDIAEIDEDFQIWLGGYRVVIPSLLLSVREGVACVFDDKENMFMPDFDVTVLYECEQAPIPVDFLHYEQDGILITLANWLNGRMPIEAIERLECYIEIVNETN